MIPLRPEAAPDAALAILASIDDVFAVDPVLLAIAALLAGTIMLGAAIAFIVSMGERRIRLSREEGALQ